jgi:single-strand DNA-binding protein
LREVPKKRTQSVLEGKLKTRSWADDAGQTRYMTEVQVDSMTMLTNREEAQQMQERDGGGTGYTPPQPANNQAQAQESAGSPDFKLDDDDDDLPF